MSHPGPSQSPLRRREMSTVSTTSETVSIRAQSRCNSQASDTQPMGCAPAWRMRSGPAPVCLWRGPADGIDDREDLAALAQGAEVGHGRAHG